MQAQEPQAQQLLLVDQVANVGAGEARAGGARAALLERPRIAGEASVAQVQPAGRGQRGARTGGAGREDAVEHVDPGPDHAQDPLRVADTHEVARLRRWKERRRPGGRLEHLLPALADREAAERMPVEAERRDLLDRAAAQLRVGGALRDPEEQLAGRALRL